MGSIFAYGYGTVVTDLEIRQDAAARLFEVFSDKRARKFVRDWKKNSPEIEWDRYLTIILLADGPEKLIADVINENEFDRRKILTGEKGALYMNLTLPKNEAARDSIPLEKEIRDAIAYYLGLCYKGVRKRDIDYYFFED